MIGRHHSGVLHEILNAIHDEGMDVLECRCETDGDIDCNYFVVQSRGKQKDFDDEKLQDIRHHIQEILGDHNAVVLFETVEPDAVDYSAIEVQIAVDAGGQSDGKAAIVLVTKRLQELGLDVEEIDEQHSRQVDNGHEVETERDLFYAVPSPPNDEAEEVVITHLFVHKTKRALRSMLKDEGIRAEVVVKPVADRCVLTSLTLSVSACKLRCVRVCDLLLALDSPLPFALPCALRSLHSAHWCERVMRDRTKGFSDLQTFDAQHALERATGTVWELVCVGPHKVELLSTAVRKLTPLGLRLLHAAHSHSSPHENEARDMCSRFFVEKPGEDVLGGEEEVDAFREKMHEVLKSTYKSEEAEFVIRPGLLEG